MRFQDTQFWKNYKEYDQVVGESSMRSTIDAVIYWRLLTAFDFKNILEIGVYQGLTTGLFFESQGEVQVTAVDPVYRLELFKKHYSKFVTQLKFINEPSQTVDLNKNFDFILIDGGHGYSSAKQDIIKFLPCLKTTGVLAIDDYKMPGVSAAINDLHSLKTDWVPFLRAEQTEFWHYRGCDRGVFIDSLFTDPISKFIFINNELDQYGNTVCLAKTLNIFTDVIEYFDLALKHYNI